MVLPCGALCGRATCAHVAASWAGRAACGGLTRSLAVPCITPAPAPAPPGAESDEEAKGSSGSADFIAKVEGGPVAEEFAAMSVRPAPAV